MIKYRGGPSPKLKGGNLERGAKNRMESESAENGRKFLRRQTAEYGKYTPKIVFLNYHCTPEKGCGTLEFGCGSIV